jgi:beta-galactosidase
MVNFKQLPVVLLLGCVLASHAASVPVYPAADPAYARSLNGAWAFKYVSGAQPGPDGGFISPEFDVSAWASIPVPANWELKGFADPFYADELKEGLGLYRRSFRVPAAWRGRRDFLRFEGVAFGYEVWVNGKKAGESSASAFNRHTFDVTDLLLPGSDADNIVAVRVVTRPHGVEFDLNDDWSLSGIYRDVSFFSVPATHVQDLTTATRLQADGSAGLSVTVALSQPEAEVRATLLGPDGRVVADAVLPDSVERQRATQFNIAKPNLWTAETPSLYRLRLSVSVGGKVVQTVEERIGLREVSIADGQLRLNGKPIKMRGVNHHDLDPVNGRAITREQMRADLVLMKKGNVNFVRTSHYPPNPALLELCDELGLYVMDEVAIGHGEKNLVKSEYRDNILARVEPTIVRDKNRASVLIWSIGNENPNTDVELDAGRLAKQLDPSRPITYPKIGSYFAATYQRMPDWVDIYAPHYPSNAKVAEYAKTLKRPTIFTEYAHALGLATDRMQEQWEMIQANPVFAGGAIWHFMDQGLLRTSAQAVDRTKPTQLVWLDQYRYYDTHGLDGTDGVTYSDRTPQTDYWQMRKVYAPVRFIETGAAVKPGPQQVALTVENRYDFRPLAGIKLAWSMQRNGKVIQQGQAPLTANARARETVRVALTVPADAAADVLTLNLRALDEQGVQINERTVLLEQSDSKHASWAAGLPRQAEAIVASTGTHIQISMPQWVLTVERASGELRIRDRAGKLLLDGIYPHSGRKPTMAEALRAKVSGLWIPSMLTALEAPVVQVEQHDGKVRLAISGYYRLPADAKLTAQAVATAAQPFDDLVPGSNAPALKPAPKPHSEGLTGGYTLEINPNGAIAVSYDFAPVGASGILSEAGLSLVAPAGTGEFRWIGQGPYAGYPGKDRLNEFGLFHLNRDDLYFQGNRRGTELAMLTTPGGAGFAIALPAGDVAVERDGERTLLSHNALIGGLGNKGTSPEISVPLEKTAHVAGSFTLVPLQDRWPQELLSRFGKPAPAKQVFQPFLDSYDQ